MATYAEFSEVVRLDHFRSLDDRFGDSTGAPNLG
jgi:hypothetical protein